MIPEEIPVFLNGQSHRISPGTTLAGLVASADPDLGAALAAGEAQATDGRGIAADGTLTLSAGDIYRVFRSARHTGGPDA
jgi:hypothetical protein